MFRVKLTHDDGPGRRFGDVLDWVPMTQQTDAQTDALYRNPPQDEGDN